MASSLATPSMSKDLSSLKAKRAVRGVQNSPTVADIVLPRNKVDIAGNRGESSGLSRSHSGKERVGDAFGNSGTAAPATEREQGAGVRRSVSDKAELVNQQEETVTVATSSSNPPNGLTLPDVNGRRSRAYRATGGGTPSSSAFSSSMVGLSNLGNTCFMNSSLQCLLYTHPLGSYFEQGLHVKDLNPSAPCKGMIATAYAKLISDMTQSKGMGSWSPKDFKRVLTKHAPHLLDYQQQDCQEFLRFMLDNMSEDLCRKPNQERVGGGSSSTSGDPDALESSMAALHVDDNAAVKGGNDAGSGKKSKFSDRLRSEVSAASQETTSVQSVSASGTGDGSSDSDRVVYEGGSVAPPSSKRPTNHSFRARAASSAAALLGMSSSAAAVDPEPSLSPIDQAVQAWKGYLRHNDSVVTDIFAGQMQSTVECMTCGHKSHSFDPFLDLSVPVPRPASEGADGGPASSAADASSSGRPAMGGTLPVRRRRASRNKAELTKCKLSDCLDKFSAAEILDDENLPTCEKCKKKRRSTKTISIFRHPQVLVIHIKRFSYTAYSRDKLETDVIFPSEGLQMAQYLSPLVKQGGVLPAHVSGSAPIYDLMGVCHHMGGLSGGHYTSFVDTRFGDGEQRWVHFNDARVSAADVSQVGGPSAYVLFYRLRS